MRIGLRVLSAIKDVDVNREANAVAVDILMKRRRVVFIFSCHVEQQSRHPGAECSAKFAGFLDSARNDAHDAPPSNPLN
jgi:hypothetical protein